MNKSITIVGGGLAGLTLAIGLRQRGVPVTVWEAGRYPRHRVCGEFISGRGLDVLKQLSLAEKFLHAGACPAHTAAFYSGKRSSPVLPLPEAAWCLSRYAMDELLAREFRRLGGELRESERWRGDPGREGVVRASGRRAEPVVDGWRWLGLKVHARNVRLKADLEMHMVPDGYVGLCRLDGEEVNVCGLFRSRTTQPELTKKWLETLSGPPDSILRRRLTDAAFVENSFCSVAGLSLTPRCALTQLECCVGDALTMIPPVTGNGMSMAFESAELAIEPLAQFSRGTVNWEQARQKIALSCDERFGRRLAWSALLQKNLFQPGFRSILFFFAPRCGWLWRGLFARTR